MSELEDWYRESLIARVDALRSATKGLQNNRAEALESLRRIGHSLRGSGGTFGFPEISAAAGKVEDASDEKIETAVEELLALLQTIVSPGNDRKTSTILVVDDDPDITHFLKVKLADPSRDILIADSIKDAEQHLEKDISLVILDLVLPDGDGRTFLMKLRENPETAGIPVIILSAKIHPTIKTECYALGAENYFEKPLNAESLSAAVASNLQRSGQLKKAARQDWLTKLPNRAAFSENFKRALSYSIRQGEPLSAAILDLDNFKAVNDTYGHGMGDEVLKRTAQVVLNSLRKSDFLARWGGEEFVVLMPNTDPKGAVQALQKALNDLKTESFSADKTQFTVSFSAGVTGVPENGTVEDVISEADRFLYLAKKAGKSQVCRAESELSSGVPKILFAEDDEVVASVVKFRLNRQGFEVIHFNDGRMALEKAASIPASLAILDVKMPGMDGFDLLSHLRQLPNYANVPILMLTGMGKEEDIIRALDLGADDYILKPFSPNELLARVRRHIRSYENPDH